MKELVGHINDQFKRSRDNLKKIKDVIKYRPTSRYQDRKVDKFDEDKLNPYEKFLIGLSKVKSKVSKIWKNHAKKT